MLTFTELIYCQFTQEATLLALFTWKVDDCEIVIHATWEIRIFATSNIDFTPFATFSLLIFAKIIPTLEINQAADFI